MLVLSLPLKQIIPVTAERTMIKTPSPATMIVGKDFSFLADETSSTGSSTNWAFNLVTPGATHFPLLASGLSPASQSAQVPNQVMIWFWLHESERQTVLPLWALVYGLHGWHPVLSVLKISLSPVHPVLVPVALTHLVLLSSGTLPLQQVKQVPSCLKISSGSEHEFKHLELSSEANELSGHGMHSVLSRLKI